MDLHQYFRESKVLLVEEIRTHLDHEAVVSAQFKGASGNAFLEMADYAVSGKMLRGILVRLGSDIFSSRSKDKKTVSQHCITLAAAIELFQAGLLAHDDIMDEDDLRRGKPTLHKFFEFSQAKIEGLSASDTRVFEKFGTSMGICAGDIYFFTAWGMLTSIGSPELNKLGALFSRELVDVCLAQMADVRLGFTNAVPSLSDILEVYAYKTARYTITLPLCAGALLEGRGDALPFLEKIGENLGILFQLQDDYLGLFGNEQELGKPIGSDIREKKKTPFMISLIPLLSDHEIARFSTIFGSKTIGTEEVEYVRTLVRQYGIDTKLHALALSYAEEARRRISDLRCSVKNFSEDHLRLLEAFIDYSLSRTH